uniref:Uncharacterized protein n=1 Tax=CrAss-like virus sp. ctYsL76 TaxID=2826826 RepID=A0A8S5QMG3_9CAUD|nr:MAG TPA: hypothetical protein [CrAss-like virus sp. ctYsL76]
MFFHFVEKSTFFHLNLHLHLLFLFQYKWGFLIMDYFSTMSIYYRILLLVAN